MTTLALLAALCLAPAGPEGSAWTVDRIVDGEWAVLEIVEPEGIRFVDLPAAVLPAGTREGARLTLTPCRSL